MQFKGKIIQEKVPLEKFKCECCKDDPLHCKGSARCQKLEQCVCRFTEEELKKRENICPCCKGLYEQCVSPFCIELGVCQCQVHDADGGEDME